MPLDSIEYTSARSLQGHGGQKRSDYDNLGYPRSRTAPGWFTCSTGMRLLGMLAGGLLAKKCIGRYVIITNAIQIEKLHNT